MLTLDESPEWRGDGRDSVTASFADNFGQHKGTFDFGTDGPGSVSYKLELSGKGIGSGLYALNSSDTEGIRGDGDGIGKGAEIRLYQTNDGVIHGYANGKEYFAIRVDAGSGEVTFSQFKNIWHSNASDDDDGAWLSLDKGDWLKIVQTLKDADGDTDSAWINLGNNVFKIEDDGPALECIDNSTINNQTHTASGEIHGLDFGSDGKGRVVLSGPEQDGVTQTWDDNSGTLTARDDINDAVLYTVKLNDDNTYTFKWCSSEVSGSVPIDFSPFKPGGPKETLTLDSDGYSVTFNGLMFNESGDATDLGSSNKNDDINPNEIGFGLGNNGNIENNEGFSMSVDKPVDGVQFTVVGQKGSIESTKIYWVAYGSGREKIDSGMEEVKFEKGNKDQLVNIFSDGEFNSLVVRFEHPEPNNDGVRVKDVSLIDTVSSSDLDLTFTATVTDADGDSAQATFTVNTTDAAESRFTLGELVGGFGGISETASRLRLGGLDQNYVNPLQNISMTVPGVAWAAALMASGNVLGNDHPRPDGGLKVTHVDGKDVSGAGLTLDGEHGTLYIESNGDYTYTPFADDLPSDASDSFTYEIVDADGSPSSAELTIGIKDTHYSNNGNSDNNLLVATDNGETLNGQGGNDGVYGGAGNDTLYGDNGNDHLIGGDGDDILYGGAGNDVLNGGAGDDKLYGGAGNDWLIGGEGEDIFIWTSGDKGTDVVADFKVGEDMLDLSALLSGANEGNLDEYLTLSFGPSTTIVVDSNGASNGGNTQTIVLEDVNLSTEYGSSDVGTVISRMLDDDSLKVVA